jgi:N6-L-threonylcarbamoyladenine synthase
LRRVKVLAIETSCDETACAVVEHTAGGPRVLSDVVHGQAVHARYGGVVPEIASRAHAEQVVPTARAALAQAGIARADAVAATAGPGLIGAVLVGLSFAKAAALGWGVPFVGVNHLEGHLLSALLDTPAPAFPFLSLVVSGGHTTLYAAHAVGDYRVLCETTDDAVGEAFDKVARMLGLGYPGGPRVEALAQAGNAGAIRFPLPRPGGRPHDLSFSGLKTAVRTWLERHPEARPEDVAAAFQDTVARYLLDRVRWGSAHTGLRRLAIGGGAAANGHLRAVLAASGLEVYLPPRERCTDNAAMIGNVAALRLAAGFPPWSLDTTARARWEVGA